MANIITITPIQPKSTKEEKKQPTKEQKQPPPKYIRNLFEFVSKI